MMRMTKRSEHMRSHGVAYAGSRRFNFHSCFVDSLKPQHPGVSESRTRTNSVSRWIATVLPYFAFGKLRYYPEGRNLFI